MIAFVQIIAHIANKSFESGYFLAPQKQVIVRPSLKKWTMNQADLNYSYHSSLDHDFIFYVIKVLHQAGSLYISTRFSLYIQVVLMYCQLDS